MVVLVLHFDSVTQVNMKTFSQTAFDVCSVDSAIFNRRSIRFHNQVALISFPIRKFTSDPVPRPILEKILNAGNWAPTGMGVQPLHFYATVNFNLFYAAHIEVKYF